MANSLYDNARKLFLEGLIDWKDDPMYVALVVIGGANYTYDPTHINYSQVSAGGANIRDTPMPLLGGTGAGTVGVDRDTTGGAADACDVTFTDVAASGSEDIGALVIYKWSGTDSTSPLIAFINIATGLPIRPNGGDIIVTWDNGPNKIFRL